MDRALLYIALTAFLVPNVARAQQSPSMPLCSDERILSAGSTLSAVVPYLRGEDRIEFVHRVYGCALPSQPELLNAQSQVWSLDPASNDAVGILAGWSVTDSGATEGAWVALNESYTISQNNSQAAGVAFIAISDIELFNEGQLSVPELDPQYYIPYQGETFDVDLAVQQLVADLSNSELNSAPIFQSVNFSSSLVGWYFSDDFIDIQFDTTPDGGRIFVDGAYIASTDVTMQVNYAALDSIEIRSDAGNECDFSRDSLVWMVEGELALFFCELQ